MSAPTPASAIKEFEAKFKVLLEAAEAVKLVSPEMANVPP